MKTLTTAIAVLLIAVGGLWALQGLNLVGGSFMTGQIRWLTIGILTMVMGALLLIFIRKR